MIKNYMALKVEIFFYFGVLKDPACPSKLGPKEKYKIEKQQQSFQKKHNL